MFFLHLVDYTETLKKNMFLFLCLRIFGGLHRVKTRKKTVFDKKYIKNIFLKMQFLNFRLFQNKSFPSIETIISLHNYNNYNK